MEIVKVNDKELVVRNYNNERIVTAWDIAYLHNKTVSEVGQQFKRNVKYLKENLDYFILNKDDISVSQIVIQKKLPNNVKKIPIFTESGYLLLVKSFNDELSWEIQRILINSYFKVREVIENNFKVPKTFKEALLLAVEQQEEIERLELENKEKQELIELQKPKADFYDTVTTSNDTIDFKQVAKVLNYNNIGRNNLMKFLRNKCVLNYRNEPYQKYVNLGYFKSVESKFIDNFWNVRINVKTVVFQKGVDFINKLLDKEYENI